MHHDPNIKSQHNEPYALAGPILNTIPIACYQLDSKSNFVYVNHKAELFFKKEQNELLGRNIWDLLPELKATYFFNCVNEAIQKRKTAFHEHLSSFTHTWVKLTVQPFQDGALVSFTEINEVKTAQKQLLEEQRRLKAAQQIGHIGHFERQMGNPIIFWSDELYRIHGLEPQSKPITLEDVITFVHPDDRGNFRRWLKNSLATKQAVALTDRIIRADGQIRFVNRRLSFTYDEQGNVNYIYGIVQDVTEEYGLKQELNESTNLLQSIFDTSLIAMSVLKAVRDEQGKIQDFIITIVNKELERETGRTDLVGKLYTQEYPGIKTSGLYDIMLRVMATGKPEGKEYYYHYDGFNKWFSCMFVKLEDGLVASNLDITERKQAEEERFKSLTLLQQSEELAGMCSWEYNLLNGVFLWSNGMYKLFNLPQGVKVKPEIYLEYVTDQSRAEAERISNLIKSGSANFEEAIEIFVDDEFKTVKIKGNVIHDDSGQPVRVLGIDLDVTNTKKAEQRMSEDSAFIKGLADAAPDMVYVIDINTLTMVYANDNIVRMFKKTAEEIRALGSIFFDAIVYPEDRPKFDRNIEALRKAKDNEVIELTYRLREGNGQLRWIKTRRTVYKRNASENPSHIIGVSQDITEQVELQEKNRMLRLERKEIERKQREEIFKATLSTQEDERRRISESLHNGLGQILYGVKLSLDQLHRSQQSCFDEDGTKTIKETEALLAAAIKESRRISHELMPTILEDFGLKAAIQDVCEQLSKSVNFKCEFTGVTAKLDNYMQTAVYRIVQELMMNVVKHAEATEGTLKVNISRSRIYMLVQDNGKGLPPTYLQSKGIGLKTIKNKVKLLNGTTSIASIPHKGTTIQIEIPYNL